MQVAAYPAAVPAQPKYAVPHTSLIPNETAVVKGKIARSRLRSVYTPEEIREINKFNAQRGSRQEPLDENSSMIEVSLIDVEVIPSMQDTSGQPAFNLLEGYIAERCYDNKDENGQVTNQKRYRRKIRTKILPPILQRNADNTCSQIPDESIPAPTSPKLPTSELADGVEVMVVFETYQAGRNVGVGVQAVIVLDAEPKWFTGVDSSAHINSTALAALGLTIIGPISGHEVVPAAPAPLEPTPQAASMVSATPMVAPIAAPAAAPTVTPVAPVAAPVSTMPAPMTVPVAPVTPAAPVQAAVANANAAAAAQAAAVAQAASAAAATTPTPAAPVVADMPSPWDV